MKKYVITGGPGIGKTTVIEILASKGYKIIPETARSIVEENQIKDTGILPWKDLEKFQAEVFERQLEVEDKNFSENSNDTFFLDRSIIDGYAYSVLGNVVPTKNIEEIAPNRYNKVFILEPLKKYKNDSIRYEDQEEGRKIHQKIFEIYKNFGYEPMVVPIMPPDDRVKFILDRL